MPKPSVVLVPVALEHRAEDVKVVQLRVDSASGGADPVVVVTDPHILESQIEARVADAATRRLGAIRAADFQILDPGVDALVPDDCLTTRERTVLRRFQDSAHLAADVDVLGDRAIRAVGLDGEEVLVNGSLDNNLVAVCRLIDRHRGEAEIASLRAHPPGHSGGRVNLEQRQHVLHHRNGCGRA